MKVSTLPPLWGLFERFQSIVADPPYSGSPDRRQAQMHGHEEALVAVIDHLSDGRRPSQLDQLARRFENLCGNRSAKHRRRLSLDRRRARHNRPQSEGIPDRVALAELVSLVRAAVPAKDWRLLWEIAEGRSGLEVAERHGLTIDNLKSRIGRARVRVRESALGRAISRAVVAA